jgi:DNA-binding NarL/FixJ family response regulator
MAADPVVVERTQFGRWRLLGEVLSSPGRRVVSSGRDTAGLIALARESGASAVVLDGYPTSNGLRAIADAVDRQEKPRVLVIGPVVPRLDVLVAMASGVFGYVSAASEPGVIADAVDAVVSGRPYVPPEISAPLFQQLALGGRGLALERSDGETMKLTGREWEVLVLIRQGRTTGEIAGRLVVANVTVRSHVFSLVRKLGLANRADLTRPAPVEPPRINAGAAAAMAASAG